MRSDEIESCGASALSFLRADLYMLSVWFIVGLRWVYFWSAFGLLGQGRSPCGGSGAARGWAWAVGAGVGWGGLYGQEAHEVGRDSRVGLKPCLFCYLTCIC